MYGRLNDLPKRVWILRQREKDIPLTGIEFEFFNQLLYLLYLQNYPTRSQLLYLVTELSKTQPFAVPTELSNTQPVTVPVTWARHLPGLVKEASSSSSSSSSLWGRNQGFAALMHCGLQVYCAQLNLVPPVISRGAPRPTTWETSVSEGGKYGRGNGRFNLAYKCDFHGKCTDILHAAKLRHGTGGFTSPPKEGMLRIFVARKIRRLQPGLNPQTWVPEASMLTTRPLKPLRKHLNSISSVYSWCLLLQL
jgi:hypothetical protein